MKRTEPCLASCPPNQVESSFGCTLCIACFSLRIHVAHPGQHRIATERRHYLLWYSFDLHPNLVSLAFQFPLHCHYVDKWLASCDSWDETVACVFMAAATDYGHSNAHKNTTICRILPQFGQHSDRATVLAAVAAAVVALVSLTREPFVRPADHRYSFCCSFLGCCTVKALSLLPEKGFDCLSLSPSRQRHYSVFTALFAFAFSWKLI